MEACGCDDEMIIYFIIGFIVSIIFAYWMIKKEFDYPMDSSDYCVVIFLMVLVGLFWPLAAIVAPFFGLVWLIKKEIQLNLFGKLINMFKRKKK